MQVFAKFSNQAVLVFPSELAKQILEYGSGFKFLAENQLVF
jgi:hypothetical protein